MESRQAEVVKQKNSLPVSEEDRQFRLLADNANVMIWQSGVDKRCDYFNKAWLDFTGRSLAQEIGLGWTRGLHPDDYQRCMETFQAAHSGRLPFTMDYHLLRQDGAYRWILSNGVPYYQQRTFAGFLGSCVDISDHEREPDRSGHIRQEQAAQREAALRELNHRLKNSLQTSICFSAHGRPLADPDTQDDLSSMTERLSLLALAHEQLCRFDDGRATGFCGYLEALAHAVHATIGNSNVRLQVVCEPVLISAKRATAIGTVVDQLLTAALTQRFPEQRCGTVQVESRPLSDHRIEVSISDDGLNAPVGQLGSQASFQRQLVERLIAHANGTIRYELDGGTRCVITLNPD